MKPFTATDDKGRKIECVLEHTIPIDGVGYALLTPNDTPVVLVREGEGEEDDEVLENWEDRQDVLAAADTCLAKLDLTLVRSAVTLTVAGEPAEVEYGCGCEDIEDDAEQESDVFIQLASFQHDSQEYGLYIPLDPFFVVARVTSENEGLVVAGDEYRNIYRIIEAELDRCEQDA